MMLPLSQPRAREGAFTIIEMVVVLVVLALAMAAIFPSIGNMLRGSSRSAAASHASGEAGLAAQLLESDVKTALGDRGTGDRTDASSFGGPTAIRLATIPSLAAGAATTTYPDIVVAGPLRLVLNADVYASAGIEQVEWLLIENNNVCGDRDTAGNNFCLRRTVRRGGAAAVITVEYPLKSRGAYPASSPSCASGVTGKRVFCYQQAYPGTGTLAAEYRWNGSWTPNCTVSWTGGGANPNTTEMTVTSNRFTTVHNAVDPPGSISRLDRIVQVGATLISGGAMGKSGERSYEHVQVGIRSRESEAYKEAIMCGQRAGWGR